ncbi:MAG: Fur family transcriptional regulator [Tissierellia bacterium]|nr:Fur family transcriptional regulator [Tissierellia bacterium]
MQKLDTKISDKKEIYEKLQKILADNKIRMSHQRMMVLKYLYTHKNHPTADKIFRDLKKEDPVLSQATVYNTLNLFVEKNIIRELDFNEKSKRYDFDKCGHAHFICEKCHNVYDLETTSDVRSEITDGYEVHQMQVIYRGICPNCLKKEKN